MNGDSNIQSNIHVGIDLGTTNTVMATCKKPKYGILKSQVHAINQYVTATRVDRNFYLPSVLFFDTDARTTAKVSAPISAFFTIPKSTWDAKSNTPTVIRPLKPPPKF